MADTISLVIGENLMNKTTLLDDALASVQSDDTPLLETLSETRLDAYQPQSPIRTTTDEQLNKLFEMSRNIQKSHGFGLEESGFIREHLIQTADEQYKNDIKLYIENPVINEIDGKNFKISRPSNVDEHVEKLANVLKKDYTDKKGLTSVLQALSFVSTIEKADVIFNKFIESCEKSDEFMDGLEKFKNDVEKNGIAHHSLLEEAHSIFTNEPIKNPYENEYRQITEKIEAEKERVWKELKVGSYYYGNFAITKKTKKYITVEFGDRKERFSKDDMNVYDKTGICNYFNLWNSNIEGLSTLFCVDKQKIFEPINSFGAEVSDEYANDLWKARPEYIKRCNEYSLFRTYTHPRMLHQFDGYENLKLNLGTQSRGIFSNHLLDDSEVTEKAVDRKAETDAIKKAIYSTSWKDIVPKDSLNDFEDLA